MYSSSRVYKVAHRGTGCVAGVGYSMSSNSPNCIKVLLGLYPTVTTLESEIIIIFFDRTLVHPSIVIYAR